MVVQTPGRQPVLAGGLLGVVTAVVREKYNEMMWLLYLCDIFVIVMVNVCVCECLCFFYGALCVRNDPVHHSNKLVE